MFTDMRNRMLTEMRNRMLIYTLGTDYNYWKSTEDMTLSFRSVSTEDLTLSFRSVSINTEC